ncbi:MAG TPA: hypothetical protein VK840_03985 [Candidatus Dormibacteraeota bacterium]|nr:hypothetical protein [Candidatus Dormibacteraeota bacterium]
MVESCAAPPPNSWATVINLAAQSANAIVVDSLTNGPRFYRVRTTGN